MTLFYLLEKFAEMHGGGQNGAGASGGRNRDHDGPHMTIDDLKRLDPSDPIAKKIAKKREVAEARKREASQAQTQAQVQEGKV